MDRYCWRITAAFNQQGNMLAPAMRLSPISPGRFPVWLDSQFEKTGRPLAAPATVMVVDDEPGVRQLTARMLRDHGYTVVEASSARDALNQLQVSGPVQLVLADIAMPGMDGISLADQMRQLYPRQPVVLMSAYSGLIAKAGLRGLPHPVLAKPFTSSQLVQKISESLRQH
jgi:CheY-like chemotaxis protein